MSTFSKTAGAFAILFAAVLAAGSDAAAQTVPPPGTPPPGTPPPEIQRQIDALGLQSTLRSRLDATGMSQDQVRRRPRFPRCAHWACRTLPASPTKMNSRPPRR